MIKITKKSFLEKLQGKNVTLVTAKFVKLSLNDCIEIMEAHKDAFHASSGRNTGKFEKTSAGYKRYIASEKAYSYAELSGSKIFTDNKGVYLIFTEHIIKNYGWEPIQNNSVMVLREAA